VKKHVDFFLIFFYNWWQARGKKSIVLALLRSQIQLNSFAATKGQNENRSFYRENTGNNESTCC
jgi:hypothetical protein